MTCSHDHSLLTGTEYTHVAPSLYTHWVGPCLWGLWWPRARPLENLIWSVVRSAGQHYHEFVSSLTCGSRPPGRVRPWPAARDCSPGAWARGWGWDSGGWPAQWPSHQTRCSSVRPLENIENSTYDLLGYINEFDDSPLFSLLIVCCELDSCLLSPLVASACARPPGMWADITSSAREENKIKYWPLIILKLFHKITGKLSIYITLSGLSQELVTISLRVSHPSVCSRVNTIPQSKPFGPRVELLPIFCLQPSAKSHEKYFSEYEFVADIISHNVPGLSVIRHTNGRLLTRRPQSVISTFLVINFSWNAKYGEHN